MLKFLTQDADLVCGHRLGHVQIKPSQKLVTIAHRQVLVETDPEGKEIKGCPEVPPTGKPCTHTLFVRQGYSTLLRVDGRRICLDTVRGHTDGFPAEAVDYYVVKPGQELVSSVA